MKLRGFWMLICISALVVPVWSLNLKIIKEASMAGVIPHIADTIKDSAAVPGKDYKMPDGKIIRIPNRGERKEIALPSVKTKLQIIAGDGFAHGRLIQTFNNPFELPLNATYIFPMPHNGAVHAMMFRTKTGVYHADLKEKEQAIKEYEQAKKAGKQASLLLQHQDNIFIQKLSNILPNDNVTVETRFSMSLSYDMGSYELAFPTTMIPRYNPEPMGNVGRPSGNPVYVPAQYRGGNTLDFQILVVAPFDLANLTCPSHAVTKTQGDVSAAVTAFEMIKPGQSLQGLNPSLLTLDAQDKIPNRDVVIRFSRKSRGRGLSVLSHHGAGKGHFALQIYPNLIDLESDKVPPLDIVFVIDKSGSMNGQPMKKSKEIMHSMLDKARAGDRISFLAFASANTTLFPEGVPATPENIKKAREWIDSFTAKGGTRMAAGVKAALKVPLETGRIRILALLTDGAIGDVHEIYQAVQSDANGAIVFAFGVGNSPNRELIDGASKYGNGIGKNLLLNDEVSDVVSKFWLRIRSPQLEDVKIDWGGLSPSALTRQKIGNLWFGQPILIFGKYQLGGNHTIRLNAIKNGLPVSETYPIQLVNNNTLVESVPKMWARETMENLMNIQGRGLSKKDDILSISLEYDVLCKYTAFLAVADSVVNKEGKMVEADVALNHPLGVDPVMAGADMAFTGKAISLPNSGRLATVYGATGIEAMRTERLRLSALQLGGTIHFHLSGLPTSMVSGEWAVFDIHGKKIISWHSKELRQKQFAWQWNLSEDSVHPVKPGVYYLALVGTPVQWNQRVIIR